MLSTTTPSMFYMYVLESIPDKERYIGYTNNLKRRLGEHGQGRNFSTKFRLPLKLVYYEAFLSTIDAKRRELYFKITQGRRFLGLGLKEYLRHRALGSGC